MREGRPKTAQPASKMSPDEPKCAHLVPLLPTLDALLRTLEAPGATFTHFEGTFGYLGHSFTHFYAFL